MIKGFEPIIDRECRILILGSMPGEESLRKMQYYGYPRNHFWKIIFTLLGVKDPEDYEFRKSMLLKNHIALWDVLADCERETSSDAKIRNPDANDFNDLFGKYPDLRNIYFNGSTAEKLFKRIVMKDINHDSLHFIGLPSTSPANTMKFEEKIDRWKVILQPLQGNYEY